jgi:uncharacterized protein
VHPEAYPVVHRILRATQVDVTSVIGNSSVLRKLRPADFVDETFGLPTVSDILLELEKPGRDPRPAFATASFAEGVNSLPDLVPGMQLEGVVTNVAAFGAFVDIGVHQDGLVHISAMAKRFVKNPRDVVKPGDVVRVKVLDVDIPRQRISLTLRLDDEVASVPGTPTPAKPERTPAKGSGKSRGRPRDTQPRERRGERSEGALADALRRAGLAD